MPLYLFTCRECMIELEELRPISQADAPLACPICLGECQRGLNLPALATAGAASVDKNAKAVRRHPAACRCC